MISNQNLLRSPLRPNRRLHPAGGSVAKTLLVTLALVGIVIGIFTWGFLAGKKRLFPFKLIRSMSETVGLAPKGIRDSEGVTSGAIDASALVALPYLQATFDPNSDLEGVVHHEKDRTLQGLSLYSSVSENEAHLIDMSGRRVKTWTHPGLRWQFVTLTPEGDLLALSPNDRFAQARWRFQPALGVPGGRSPRRRDRLRWTNLRALADHAAGP